MLENPQEYLALTVERDKKLMLGHAFSDVTNKVYLHRTLEDLRGEIEKIKLCR